MTAKTAQVTRTTNPCCRRDPTAKPEARYTDTKVRSAPKRRQLPRMKRPSSLPAELLVKEFGYEGLDIGPLKEELVAVLGAHVVAGAGVDA